MRTQSTAQKIDTGAGKGTRLLALALGMVLAVLVAMIGLTEREAQAALTERIVFDSNRTTGAGVNNPTGDYEVFKMNPDGTGVKQLTANKIDDYRASLSPDGTKIAYQSYGVQPSNLEGDNEIYSMIAADGSGQTNLTNNGTDVQDYSPDWGRQAT